MHWTPRRYQDPGWTTSLYNWENMRKTVDYVKSCHICQKTKARNHKPYGLLQPIEPPESNWDVTTMDFSLPLPKTKNGDSGILNVVCKLSKMIRIIPVKSIITPPGVAMKFKEYFYRNHGLPTKIISDQDRLFMSKFLTALFKSLGTKLASSIAYYPQTDGPSEIVNQKVEEMIRAFANYKKDNWEEYLVDFEVAYNSAVNSTTLCSLFFVNDGIHSRTILLEGVAQKNPSAKSFLDVIRDTRRFVHKRIIEQNKRMADYANKPRNPDPFLVGDKVWLATKNLSIED